MPKERTLDKEDVKLRNTFQKEKRPPEEWVKEVNKDARKRVLEGEDQRDRKGWKKGCETRPTEL